MKYFFHASVKTKMVETHQQLFWSASFTWLWQNTFLKPGCAQTYLSLHYFCCFHIWGLSVICDCKRTERLTITNYFYWTQAEWKWGVKIQVQVSSKWFVLVLLIKTKERVVCRINSTREPVIGDSLFLQAVEDSIQICDSSGETVCLLKAE